MRKFIDSIKDFCKWVSSDGLLHILVCYAVMLAITPLGVTFWSGAAGAIILAAIPSIVKEGYDYMRGASWQTIWHDLLCDAIGMGLGLLTLLLWWLCNL